MLLGLFTHLEWHWSWPKIWPMIHGATQAARESGVRIFILDEPSSGWQAESGSIARIETEYAQYLDLFDGFVSVFPNPDFGRYAASIYAQGKPVVLIGRETGEVPRVLVDNCDTFRGAVKRLASRGHRRILFMAGPAGNLCASERLRGYRLGLEDAGIPFDPTLVLPMGFSEETAIDAIAKFLAAGQHCTAVLSTNDLAAHSALEVLTANGLRVPEDVELVGFDNVPNSLWSTPALSTFEMHAEQLGGEAVRACIDLIRGVPRAATTIVRSTYIPRSSTRGEIDLAQAARFDLEGACERLNILDDKLDIEATISSNLLGELAGCLSASGISASECAELLKRISLHEAACITAQRRIDARFNLATLRLKELSFRQLPEFDILRELWSAFRQLGITHLGAQVNFTPDPSSGQWYLNGEYIAPSGSDSVRIREFLDLSSQSTSAVMVPLTYEKLRFGFILVEADSAFAPRFWELIRDFSAALYSVRLMTTLRANRALEEATKAAQLARADAERSYQALKESQDELRRTQAELVESSRLAGIGEMAREILHKVGNTLNSVNTSVGVLDTQTKSLRVRELKKALELLVEQTRLPTSSSTTEKINKVVEYLRAIATAFESQQTASLKELQEAKKMLDEVIGVVASQSSHAKAVAMKEVFPLGELIGAAVDQSIKEGGEFLLQVDKMFAEKNCSVSGTKQRMLASICALVAASLQLTKKYRPGASIVLGLETSKLGTAQLTFSAPALPREAVNAAFLMSAQQESLTGLCLHDAANAMAEMGGRLFLRHDELGGKSVFVFSVPLA